MIIEKAIENVFDSYGIDYLGNERCFNETVVEISWRFNVGEFPL